MNNTFKVLKDGKEVELVVNLPNDNQLREADKIYNRAFRDAVESGAILRLKVEDVLRQQGLWNNEKEMKVKVLRGDLAELEKAILRGGTTLKAAKNLAFQIKDKRNELLEVLGVKNSLDQATAEAQADDARFDYLVSQCVVYNDTKKPYFKDLSDYLNSSTSLAAILGARTLLFLMSGLEDYESKLVENKFLKRYGFTDDKYRLVNKEGKWIDREGRLLNEDGRYINENGEFIDKEGNRVDLDGNPLVDFTPFIDDDGNPILEDKQEEKTIEGESAPKVDLEPVTLNT